MKDSAGALIRVEIEDGVGLVLMDNPPINGLTPAFLEQLLAQLERLGNDDSVQAIILASAIPNRFCGGLDLPAFLRSSPVQVHEVVSKLYVQLHELQARLPKPTIAAIAGAVRGGGMSVAITCDMLVAADDATFGYPELDVGLLPAIHYNHLPRIVGRYRAFDLLFTGRVFTAQEAMQLGLVSRITTGSQLLAEARKIARVFAAKSPELMRLGKAAFKRTVDSDYVRGAASAVDLVSTVFGTTDSREGLEAFEQKRRPNWGKRPDR